MGSARALPKVHRVICSALVSHLLSLSYTNVFTPPPPHPRNTPAPCSFSPLFLGGGGGGGEEVTFINGEFMCMTASKPELCLDRPWRLSINSSNHQSAKYFPFRAHQLCMRWPAVIYRKGRVRRSAHLHRYRYGGSAAPVPETDRSELEPQNGEALTFSYSACSKHRCHKLKKKKKIHAPTS